MPSLFDLDMAEADGIITAYYGEPVQILPRVPVRRGAPIADPARCSGIVTGVFTLAPANIPLEGSRRGSDGHGSTTFTAADAKVWLSKASLIELGWKPRAGDAVGLPDRPAEPTYSVADTDPSDIGDVTLHLTRETPA